MTSCLRRRQKCERQSEWKRRCSQRRVYKKLVSDRLSLGRHWHSLSWFRDGPCHKFLSIRHSLVIFLTKICTSLRNSGEADSDWIALPSRTEHWHTLVGELLVNMPPFDLALAIHMSLPNWWMSRFTMRLQRACTVCHSPSNSYCEQARSRLLAAWGPCSLYLWHRVKYWMTRVTLPRIYQICCDRFQSFKLVACNRCTNGRSSRDYW